MKLSSILLLSLAESFLVGATNTCHADNCARAVSGTQQGYGHLYTASSDCSSFVGTSTVTSCVTSTVAWTIVTVTPSLLKRYGPSSSSIPLYASACTDSEAYSSACSCLGITQHTVTSTDAVLSVTATITVTAALNFTATAQGSSAPTPLLTSTASGTYTGSVFSIPSFNNTLLNGTFTIAAPSSRTAKSSWIAPTAVSVTAPILSTASASAYNITTNRTTSGGFSVPSLSGSFWRNHTSHPVSIGTGVTASTTISGIAITKSSTIVSSYAPVWSNSLSFPPPASASSGTVLPTASIASSSPVWMNSSISSPSTTVISIGTSIGTITLSGISTGSSTAPSTSLPRSVWTNSSSHASHTTYTLPPAYTFSIPIVTTASTTFISSGSGIWNTSTSSTTPLYPNSSWTTVPSPTSSPLSSCNGQVCGSFETCGIAETCFCFTTADGGGSCGQNAICEDLADCQSNSDCDEDSICAVNSCCERNVCLPGGCDNPAAKLMRMAGST